MLLFALSFQGQVEKYGVYVGIAAFFGLAVLSLLYFSQARELKRLREWAGRAPERARELEQRVVAQAGAKGAMSPPRRLAEMPAPPAAAAQTAAGAQATELADAVPAEDEPATNGNVPAAPGAAAGAANGAAPPAEQAPESEDGAAQSDGTKPEEAEVRAGAVTPDEATPDEPRPDAAAASADAARADEAATGASTTDEAEADAGAAPDEAPADEAAAPADEARVDAAAAGAARAD